MNYLDWIVLFGTLIFIVLYGTLKTRGSKNIESYLKGDNSLKWWMIGVSIMATQASAITFISTPGQAIVDGMRFLQFYFGLPIAMVIISVTMVPIYYRLKVFTAYEYLESRFDLKTRTLGAILFLVHRGLAVGITLFAPSLVLSVILNWNVIVTTVIIGFCVILYVTMGGTRAVSLTQRQQMAVIMTGMLLAGFIAFKMLPDHISFSDSVAIAGELGKFNLVNLNFDPDDRFNIWSGLLGGTFLFLSYFGTDQSQVARYLGGRSITESRMGLIFNGLLKIPMQFVILFIGVMVYVFFLFNKPPVFYNEQLRNRAMEKNPSSIASLENDYNKIYDEKSIAVSDLVKGLQGNDEHLVEQSKATYKAIEQRERDIRGNVKQVIADNVPGAKTQDSDYIFLNFVMHHLPNGIVGLLLAVMFSAAMSSMASELNSLASTTTVDIYKRSFKKEADPRHYLVASRAFTVLWALIAMTFSILAGFAENLIQFVNIVGSLFYGTILGIFVAAFYIRKVKGTAVFIAALVAQAIVFYCYFFTKIAFLWYCVIGCMIVVVLAWIIQTIAGNER